MKQAIVAFRYEDTKIYGIHCMPDHSSLNSEAVLYLPGSVLGISAVHRLGFQIAEDLTAKGFQCFLINPPFVDESDGNPPEGTHDAVSRWVMDGNLVSGYESIIDQLFEQFPITSLTLIGHCAGALNAIFVGARKDRIRKLILLSPPVIFPQSKEGREFSESTVDEYFSKYFLNLFSFSRWKKFVTGGTDYRLLFRVLSRKFFGKNKDWHQQHDRFNGNLTKAMQEIQNKGTPSHFIFGDKDMDLEPFLRWNQMYFSGTLQTIILPETSHGFVTVESMDLLLGKIRELMRS